MTHPQHSVIARALGAVVLAASVLPGGVFAEAAPATQFTIQPVSFPTDPRFTQLLGINNENTIAGYHGDENTENTPNKGFTLKLPANFTDENFPNSAQTQVIGINKDNDTVGFYVDQAGTTHGFMKSKDFANVDLPGTTFNQLLGINDHDKAAGYFQDAAGLQHAYVYNAKDGTFLVLNIPMPSSQATGINDDGTVVGFEQPSPTASTSSGYILKEGKLTVLNAPGSNFTQALGINNKGEVVGSFVDAAGTTHGFMYRDGHFDSVDAPGATSTIINGLNDNGRLVGFFADQNGNTIGLVGDPVAAKTNPRTVTFDDLTATQQPLNGQYPSGVIDWGSNAWFLSAAYGKDATNSVSFNGAGPTSATFTLLDSRRLVSIDLIDGGTTGSTVTLSCAQAENAPVTVKLAEGQSRTVATGWTKPCSTVTISSSNGWYTNFDNLVLG